MNLNLQLNLILEKKKKQFKMAQKILNITYF